ncbi:MAG: PAS domain S-box protein [Betaproteobacteria bacterium]
MDTLIPAVGSSKTVGVDFRALLDALPAAAYTCDDRGFITYYNRRAVEIWGREPKLNDPADRYCGSFRLFDLDGTAITHDRCWMARCVMERTEYAGREIVVERPDGTRVEVQANATPLHDDSGTLLGAVNVLVDITDRKRAEATLRESEERYRRLVNLIPAAVYTCEAPSGIITFYNEHAAQLWGRAPQLGSDTEMRFCGSYRLWKPGGELIPHDETPMALAIREGRSFRNQDIVIERPDGSRISVLVSIDPIRDNNGKIIGAINTFHDTTALRHAEDALRQNERRFREIIDALPSTIYTTDACGRLTHYNSAAVKFSGRVPELGNDSWCVSWKLYRPDGTPLPHDECPMAESLKTGRAVRGREAIAERPDGTRRWFEPYPTPLRDEAGNLVGGVNMLVDITERKHAELQRVEALQREQLARTEAETLNKVALTLAGELEPRILVEKVTEAATRLTNAKFGAYFYNVTDEHGESYMLYTLSGAPRAAFEKFGVPRNTPLFDATFHGGVVRIDDVLRDPRYGKNPPHNGMPKGHLPVRSYLAVPVIARSGAVLGGLFFGHPDAGVFTEHSERIAVAIAAQAAIAIDNARLYEEARREITHRRNTEQVLRESEDRFRSLVSVVTDVPWTTDASGAFVTEQSAWSQYTGQTWEECRGFGWNRALHPDDRETIKNIWLKAVADYGLYKSEGRVWHAASQQYRYFVARATPMFNADGSVREWVGACTDVHEQRLAEHALKDADRRKDEFLAQLAHELRNPLAPVSNAAQLLRMKAGNEPEMRWIGDVVERQVNHLTRLIDDLIDVSRITRNKLELRKQTVDLAEIVQAAVESTRPVFETRNHNLTVNLPPGQVLLHGDLVRLAQVFTNLLNNAGKYTESGGSIALVGEIAANGASKTVAVRVKDTGVGIPAAELGCVFDMFFQVDNSLGREGGLGIGLALVRRLVEMHGGSVEAHSDGPGKGSEFIVRLPIVESNPDQSSRELRSRADRAAFVAKTIVIADDNRDAAHSLAMLLDMNGSKTHIAYDGVEALQKLQTILPDVALLDLGMPALDGYELCRRVRQEPWGQDMVLIALTGWGQDADRLRTRQAGFDGHLVKPVDSDTLGTTIAELAARRAGKEQHGSAYPGRDRAL